MNGQSNTTLHQQALSGVVLSNSLHIPGADPGIRTGGELTLAIARYKYIYSVS